MYEFAEKPPEFPEKRSGNAMTRAKQMLCELSGPRGWNDTREFWLARGARRARLSLRRAKAIFYEERIRLTADEYLAIEQAFEAAHAAVATVSSLASDANVRRRSIVALRSTTPGEEG